MSSAKRDRAYWFYLEPFVHISIKTRKVFLYNTLNGKALEYKNEPEIEKIVKQLLSKKNLLVIKLRERDLKENPLIDRFVARVIKSHMGDLLDVSLSSEKPIQLLPMVNIQRDVSRLKKDPSRSLGENILNYLDEISFYINDRCEHERKIFYDGFKQFLFVMKGSGRREELKLSDIAKLLDEAGGSTLSRVNILGGNVFHYPEFEGLVSLLKSLKPDIERLFHVHYTQAAGQEDKLALIAPGSFRLRVLVDFPVDRESLEHALKTIGDAGMDAEYEFVVQGEKDFSEAQELVSCLGMRSYSFQPYFNGRNLTFFKKYVFVNKRMVLASKPSIEEILARQVVNAVNFGRVTVLPDGDVFANVNAKKIGRLGRDSLYEMLCHEMYHGRSWRRVRGKVMPCKECVYERLCPPLSNYEYALAKNNLCHTWKESNW